MSTSVTENENEEEDPAASPPRSRRLLVVGGAVAALAVVAAVAVVVLRDDDEPPAAGPPPPPDLALVGDSFAQQSSPQLQALADQQGFTLEASALGGTSICHFDPVLEGLAQRPPRVLVLSFAGNDLPNSCFNPTSEVRDAATVAAGYRPELDEVVDRFLGLGSKVYVVLPPPIRDAQYEARASAMRTVYREAHDARPELGLIDSATRLDPNGEGYVTALPCEDWDTECPAGGEVVLRQDDGIHLTEAGGERYARAILDVVAPDL